MKTVLITGATSGIGLALSQQYHQQGWRVIACGRNQEALAQLHAQGLQTRCFDMTDPAQIRAACADLPLLDCVILNAGTCEYIDDAQDFDAACFERVIQVNVIAVGYCLQALLPHIRRPGRLALMGSSASYLPFPRAEAYGSSKAAIAYLASSLALDLASHQIEVSLICPGFVKTPLTDKNDFAMPMRISPDTAARTIIQALARGQHEIHFPKRFTLFLKLLAWLPASVWRTLATRMRKQ